MDLHHEFIVNVPIDKAWAILTDIELIAPCLPGAQLTAAQGDTYFGNVKVKVGPILAKDKLHSSSETTYNIAQY
jgi:carbon monoxide dehydrogenase subunit G